MTFETVREIAFTFPDVEDGTSYAAVLVRLSRATRQEIADIVDLAWRYVAPKRLVTAFDTDHR